MAIYHLHVGIVSRSTGRSAVAAAAYRSADKLHNEYDGITHDYTNRSSISAAAYRSGERLTNEQGKIHDFSNKRGVVYSEIMLPNYAPNVYADRQILWNSVEKAEKRYDAQTARDIDVALPIEFDRQEQIEVIRGYIQSNFVSHGMIADFAIHDKQDGNPHAHILLTTREVSAEGFGKKNRDWNSKARLKSWRENWADVCNKKLQEKGLDDRIDHRTLKAQGIDREPTIHIGVTAKAMEQKGCISDRMREYNEIVARNEALSLEAKAEYMHELKQGYFILDKEIAVINNEIDEAKQEMNTSRVKAEEITERAEYISNTREQLEELYAQRGNMGFFKSKKVIDQQIQRLEDSHEIATSYFRREFDVLPEQAETEIQRLEGMANSKKHLQEKLQDKLTPLIEEKESFMIEYQRQKLLADISPERQKIQDRLTRLDKESLRQRQSPKDNIAWARNEWKLDDVSERNFQEILKQVNPEQARAFIERSGRESEREISRGYVLEHF